MMQSNPCGISHLEEVIKLGNDLLEMPEFVKIYIQNGTVINVEHGKDSPSNSQDGRVQIGAIDVKVQLHMVIRKAL